MWANELSGFNDSSYCLHQHLVMILFMRFGSWHLHVVPKLTQGSISDRSLLLFHELIELYLLIIVLNLSL